MSNSGSALLPVFRSDLQVQILSYMLMVDGPIGISELARTLEAQQSTVHREVARLVDAGVLTDQWVGRTRLVSANRQNPAYGPLRKLMEVVYGPAVLLRAVLAGVAGIGEAFIYGSWAARYSGIPGKVPVDIDLMIISSPAGGPDLAVLHAAVSSAERRLHREVNFLVIGADTWDARAADPFLAGIDADPTVTVLEADR